VKALPVVGRLCSVGLVALLLTPLAHADPKDDARRHFGAGLAAAQAKQYDVALAEFLAAQNAWGHPATLYNIARSYQDLGDLPNAVAYYRLYEEALPEKKEDVEPVIAVLEAQIRLAQRAAEGAGPVSGTPASGLETSTGSVTTAPPVTPTDPTAAAAQTGSASAPANTAASADRLAAIAAELEDIRRSLAAGGAPATVGAAPSSGSSGGSATATSAGAASTGPSTGTPPAVPPPTDAPVAVPNDGALLSDAYERVVITASRYGQAPLDSPSTVTILSEDDIRLSGAASVPDLLRRVAGVDVMELAAAKPDVSIRGFNREISNKVLVLIDGRSTYVDFLGTVFWSDLTLSLDEIERIEIIRGPGSAVYGANAMTGVINIITRVPGQGHSLARVDAGTPDLLKATVLADGRRDKTAWRVSFGWDELGRWSATADPTTQTALVPFFDDQDISLAAARANVRVDQAFLDKGLASVSGGWSKGRTEFYALGALGDFAFDFNSAFARADLAYGPVHFRTFYNTLDGAVGPWQSYAGQRSLDTYVNSDTVDGELEAVEDFKTGPVAHRLNAGVGYRWKSILWDWLDPGDEPIRENHVSGFLQEEAKIGPVSLVASLRADKDPKLSLGKTLSPRGAAIVRVAPKTSIRVTGGTAYRTPAFLESYLDLNQPTAADGVYVQTLGDTELDPERIYTAEVGVHDESTPIHTADLALYANRVTNLISLTSLTPTIGDYDPVVNGFSAGTTGFENSADIYTALGGELDLRVFPVDGLDVYANLALERITDDNGTAVVVDNSTSTVKVNGGVMYRSPFRTDASLHLSYVGPQTWRLRDYDEQGQLVETDAAIASRTILSARLATRPFADQRLELAANGWNLLQLGKDGFYEHPKGQLVGARVWGEATWRF